MEFPPQIISDQEKEERYGSVEKWAIEMADVIERASSFSSRNENSDLDLLYDLAEGKMDIADVDLDKHIKKYGKGDYTFPAEMDHKDQITPRLHLLYGEEIKRPNNFRVVNKGSEISSQLLEKEKNMIMQMLDRMLVQQLTGEEQQIQTPEQIRKYLTYDFKDIAEVESNNVLRYLTYNLDLPSVFQEGFKHRLNSGREIYWTGLTHSEPDIEAVDPRYFDYEKFPGMKKIEEASWWVRWRFIPASQAHDEYWEDLTEDDKLRLDDIQGGRHASRFGDQGAGRVGIFYRDLPSDANYVEKSGSTLIRVAHYIWRGKRKVGFVTYIDQYGELQEKMVDENYKVKKHPVYLHGIKDPEHLLAGEHIEWDWINALWETTRIGEDIFTRIQPVPVAGTSINNPNQQISPYCGVHTDYSLVRVLKPLNYLYNRIWWRTEMMIARAKGQGFIMDMAQIPKSMGISVEKWLYYLDVMNVAFINSFEEGTKGRTKGMVPNFNQFQAFNMTLTQGISQMLEILNKIEQQMGYISGISDARMGQIQTSELVNNVQREVIQSNHITEPLFKTHEIAKRSAMQNLLEWSKVAWEDGKKLQYIGSDMSRVFFSVTEKFLNSEIGLFLTDSSEEDQIYETIKQLGQTMVQADPSYMIDFVKMLKNKSIVEAEKVLEEMNMQRQQQAQQAAEAEQQAAAQQQEREDERFMMELEQREKQNIRDNETKILIAGMNQGEGEEAVDITNDSLDREKLSHQKYIDERKLDREDKKLRQDAEFKDKELKLKSRQISKQSQNKSNS